MDKKRDLSTEIYTYYTIIHFILINKRVSKQGYCKIFDNIWKKGYNHTEMNSEDKTIIAIATALGSGAIGVIRISGKHALSGVSEVFAPFKGEVTPRKAYFGEIKAGEYRDQILAVYFAAPASYTGEDSVELYCHGSVALMQGIVRYLIKNAGFTQAEGGDFTARAFKNGKLDLTEAEGVLDMINARSEAEIRGAYTLLSGSLREKIEKIQQDIVFARAQLEAAIDYPEEDVEEIGKSEAKLSIENIKKQLDALISGYETARLEREGVRVALVGKPNAGKSSLMNALLGYERAIVTAEQGTTRDTLTEGYIYKGVRFLVTDTAGLRESESLPEQMGVERAYQAAQGADLVIMLVEAGEEADKSLKAELTRSGRKVIEVENKIDVKRARGADVCVSAKTGENIDELKEKLYDLSGLVTGGGASINNARQYGAAVEALSAVERALKSVNELPPELISSDLYDAYSALGKITGITGSDALAGEIFKHFCVGK